MSFRNAQGNSFYADACGACCAVRSSAMNNMIAGIVCAMSVLFVLSALILRLRLLLGIIILAIIILSVVLVLPFPRRRKR